ncbi:hypothetical protein IGB42_04082 [Andreprevotia sp. IGB-42]|uniref:alpha/beta hydrolase family protein n=1 Tax=Andreprevotia sp. IGB-42 TaxID=2497473 RepID=UPI00135A6A7D|nr:hypothetical protein [Andreprevotia sp. IGB-42]KAF0811464.1 hypothetical protein IGB42_04082 [Andreprevotia sp. IGB-42]
MRIAAILLFAVLNLAASAAHALQPPGDSHEQYERWLTRSEAERPDLSTDALLDWSHLEVKAWWQPQPAPYALILHGSQPPNTPHDARYLGMGDDVHALLYSMGFHVVELLHRGYGESEGARAEARASLRSTDDDSYIRALLRERANDIRPVLRWLDSSPRVKNGGILIGHSAGGLTALYASNDPAARSVKAVVSLEGGLGSGPLKLGVMEQGSLDTFLRMSKTPKPTFIVHAPNDAIVSYTLGEAIATQQAAVGNSVFISPDLPRDTGKLSKGVEGYYYAQEPHTLVIGKGIKTWKDALYSFLTQPQIGLE